MRHLVVAVVISAAWVGAGPAQAQQFYRNSAAIPSSGRDLDFLEACWSAIRSELDGHPIQQEAIMVPQYSPLTERRKARYGLTGPVTGMVYADTTMVVWTTDNAGVAFPLALRCEAPIDPRAPDFARIHLSEDQSLNPNIPPEARPPRE